mgnify:CR=1 FL=1
MGKKYDSSEIITLVDRAFTNFEREMSSGAEKLGKKVPEDSQFGTMLSRMKFAIMGEIMSILKEDR